jgi:membrane protein implicated in regulation of membrane protease activity
MEQLWLTILGVVSIILEMGFISGIGFLFIGIGALSVAGLIEFNIINKDNLLSILLALVSLSSLYFLIFWKFFKKAHMQTLKNYNDIIDKEAVVIYSDIKGHTIGNVKWSGTIMNAQLVDTNDYVKEGETVKIIKIKGNILFIKSTKE